MYAGETFDFEHAGKQFRAYVELDDDTSAPWERAEGHGVVTDWTTRDKKPGELVLIEDRRSKRFYDVPASLARAKSEGWGLSADEVVKLSRTLGRTATGKECIARAVEMDYEFLRAWCNDEWQYIGVCVCLLTDDGEPVGDKYAAALWGIESNADDYIHETARELTGDALSEAKRVLQSLQTTVEG